MAVVQLEEQVVEVEPIEELALVPGVEAERLDWGFAAEPAEAERLEVEILGVERLGIRSEVEGLVVGPVEAE